MSNIVLSHHASDLVPGSPYNKKTWKKLDEIAAMQECADNQRMLCLMKKYRRSSGATGRGVGVGVSGVVINNLPLTNIYEDDEVEEEGGRQAKKKQQLCASQRGTVVVGNDEIENLELRLSQILDQADQLCSTTTAVDYDDDEEEEEKDLPPRNEPQQQDKDQEGKDKEEVGEEEEQHKLGHEKFGFETDSTWDDFLNDLPLDS